MHIAYGRWKCICVTHAQTDAAFYKNWYFSFLGKIYKCLAFCSFLSKVPIWKVVVVLRNHYSKQFRKTKPSQCHYLTIHSINWSCMKKNPFYIKCLRSTTILDDQLKKSDIFFSSMTMTSKRLTAKRKKTMYFQISIIRLGRISPNWVLYESILQIVPFSLNDGWE